MKDNQSKYSVAIIISVGLHVVLLVLLGLSATSAPLKPQPKMKTIQAVVVSEQAVKQHADRIKRTEQEKRRKEQQRLQQAEDRINKLNEERRQKEAAIVKAKNDQRKAKRGRAQSKR